MTVNLVIMILFLVGLLLVGLSALDRFSSAQDQVLENQGLIQAQTCLIIKSTIVEIEASRALFDAFARHFGVHVVFPELPAPPHTVGCSPAGGDDVFLGTNGRDVIRATQSGDFIAGYGGNDLIFGRPGNDTIFGGPGNDVIWGNEGPDILNGDAGNDIINARYKDKGQGRDVVDGGSGFDTCYINSKDRAVSCEKVIKVKG